MMRPLQNNVIFQFLDGIDGNKNNMFVEKTKSGLILPSNAKNSAGDPRWVKVVAVGPDVVDVEVDMKVLVEAGKWTTAIEINDESFWKTDDEWIIAIDDQ